MVGVSELYKPRRPKSPAGWGKATAYKEKTTTVFGFASFPDSPKTGAIFLGGQTPAQAKTATALAWPASRDAREFRFGLRFACLLWLELGGGYFVILVIFKFFIGQILFVEGGCMKILDCVAVNFSVNSLPFQRPFGGF